MENQLCVSVWVFFSSFFFQKVYRFSFKENKTKTSRSAKVYSYIHVPPNPPPPPSTKNTHIEITLVYYSIILWLWLVHHKVFIVVHPPEPIKLAIVVYYSIILWALVSTIIIFIKFLMKINIICKHYILNRYTCPHKCTKAIVVLNIYSYKRM